jgi:hypothetical protein
MLNCSIMGLYRNIRYKPFSIFVIDYFISNFVDVISQRNNNHLLHQEILTCNLQQIRLYLHKLIKIGICLSLSSDFFLCLD